MRNVVLYNSAGQAIGVGTPSFSTFFTTGGIGDGSSNPPTLVRREDGNTALGMGVTPMISETGANTGPWRFQRAPVIFKNLASTAVVAGTGITVWTPGAGKKFRLMGWLLSLSVAGQIIFGDNAIATIIARTETIAAAGVSKLENMGLGLLSAAANNVLKIDVTANGNIAGMVWGTEE